MLFGFTSIDECDCTIQYGEELKGKSTQCEYIDKGKFFCPSCKKTHDYSNYTFEIIVEIKDICEDGEHWKELKIVGGEKRIEKQCEPGNELSLVIKECIEEDLNEGCYLSKDWLQKHITGKFKLHVYYESTSYWTDCGTEYDLNFELLLEEYLDKEKQLVLNEQ